MFLATTSNDNNILPKRKYSATLLIYIPGLSSIMGWPRAFPSDNQGTGSGCGTAAV